MLLIALKMAVRWDMSEGCGGKATPPALSILFFVMTLSPNKGGATASDQPLPFPTMTFATQSTAALGALTIFAFAACQSEGPRGKLLRVNQ